MRVFTKAEVAEHHTARSVWIIVDGKVYDVTEFMFDHPGGEEIIMQFAGKDVSDVMRDLTEHAHSDSAFEMLDQYLIGELVDSEKKTSAAARKASKEEAAAKKEIFIDVTKPMLQQVWTKNFTKEFYMKQVHIPRHCAGSAPIFGPAYLEIFTLTPWYVVPLVWGPVSLYHTINGFYEWSLIPFVALWTLGLLNWTLLEYGIHRILFHVDDLLPDNRVALTLHFLMHGIHHYLPMDGMRLVMPPVLFFILSYPVYSMYKYFLPMPIVSAVAGGTYFGYILYDLMHYYLHHGKPFGQHLKEMKTYHLDHHYKEPNLGFGITSKLWDYVFNTVLV